MIKKSRGKAKKQQTLDKAKEFMQAFKDLGREKGIAPEVLFDAIEAALISAYRRNFSSAQNVRVLLDRDTGEYHVYAIKNVVEDVTSDVTEISLADARAINPDYEPGDVLEIEVTPANVHDIQVAAKLIREDDEVVYGDSGYLGIEKREEIVSDAHLSGIDYRINRRPSSLQKVSENSVDWDRIIEHAKSSVRCKVEHPFRTVKCLFGYRKVAYKGLAKNENRLYALFASANLYALASRGRSLAAAW